ncbi:tryptophan 2,3-dioxygenase family protein [Parafrankia discariae]|uniref:tryptophan 2,3-dioxygenase family protein n=1 Tax=Parafrankia discariae TaxID=365528 RepID=UPI00037F7A7C|nr:tryptophan 2,3-dioxygenase family protein [Parafrankia discariae]
MPAPETDGEPLTYATYLRLTQLLDQQRCRSSPTAHDELLFITIHQVYELWFKVLLFELADARDRMLRGDARGAGLRLRRCQEIERVLVGQIEVVDTMSPRGFLQFRGVLGTSSGFQSAQFREIEFLSGTPDDGWLARAGWLSSDDRAQLCRRLAEPDLWDAFLTLVGGTGFAVATEHQRAAALAEIAGGDESAGRNGGHGELWDLSEALLSHDQMWSAWRARHLTAVVRQLGEKPGTGGSAGAGYLRARVDLRFYPELWAARSLLAADDEPRETAPGAGRR